ncbi:MAG: hypothetical protein CSA49_05710, partial [Gammaproteobacteria bacterium]
MDIENLRGFTLLELMVVLVIIAVLAVMTYPSYLDAVRKSHRKEAAGELLKIAAGIERVKAQRFSYISANGITHTLPRYQV